MSPLDSHLLGMDFLIVGLSLGDLPSRQVPNSLSWGIRSPAWQELKEFMGRTVLRQHRSSRALRTLGPAAKDPLPKLVAQLDHEEVRLVNPIAKPLRFFGDPDSKSVVRQRRGLPLSLTAQSSRIGNTVPLQQHRWMAQSKQVGDVVTFLPHRRVQEATTGTDNHIGTCS